VEELQAFEAGRAGMQGGFAGTFDKLDRDVILMDLLAEEFESPVVRKLVATRGPCRRA
jgi:hypothetical protein